MIFPRFAPVLLASLLAGCATGPTFSHAEGVDWSTFRTYSWIDRPDPNLGAGLIAREVIETELGGKGYRRVDQGGDLLVGLFRELKGQDKTSGKTWADGRLHRAAAGELVLDILDGKSRRLLWRATEERRFPADQSQADRETMVRGMLQGYLDRFPPK